MKLFTLCLIVLVVLATQTEAQLLPPTQWVLELGAIQTSIAWSKDGQRLVTAGYGNNFDEFFRNGEKSFFNHSQTSFIDGSKAIYNSITYSPNSEMIALGGKIPGSNQGILYIYHHLESQGLEFLVSEPHSLHFDPTSTLLAIASEKSSVLIFEPAGSKLWGIGDRYQKVFDTQFSKDGKRILITGISKNDPFLVTADWWDLENRSFIEQIYSHKSQFTQVPTIAFSQDGSTMALGYVRNLGLVQAPEVEIVNLVDGHSTIIASSFSGERPIITLSANGKYLAYSTNSGAIQIWDISKEQIFRIINYPAGSVCRMVFSPDSTLLTTSTYQGQLNFDALTLTALYVPTPIPQITFDQRFALH